MVLLDVSSTPGTLMGWEIMGDLEMCNLTRSLSTDRRLLSGLNLYFRLIVCFSADSGTDRAACAGKAGGWKPGADRGQSGGGARVLCPSC